MVLAPGEKLGPYEIVGAIGKGGMGEVYRARDTRLGRDVAIKISAKEFNERFEREARAISSLNHPNICTLYDVGPNYLVMEFVEGETLSKILSRGSRPLDKTLDYAGQITSALAAAHAKGIVHRDLKPGNIMVTSHGVKVLDFGLAKLSQVGQLSAEGSSEVATMTEPITQSGSIVGTLHYMSPEQVEGKDVDERSDIFAFGAVLYEMITGQRAFDGDTKAAIMAAVMKDQPVSVRQLRPEVPRSLDRLVRKCLEKKPEDRWRSAHDLKPTIEMIDLDAISSASQSGVAASAASSASASGISPSRQLSWLTPAVAIVAILALAVLGWNMFSSSSAESEEAVQFEVGVADATVSSSPMISPDGRRLAFIALGNDGESRLWVRSLETLEAHPLDGTDGARGYPFWSWDSRALVYSNGRQIRRIDASGGPSQPIADLTADYRMHGGFWSPDDRVVFALDQRPTGQSLFIYQVPASGGDLTLLHPGTFPSLLPDATHYTYGASDGIHVARRSESDTTEVATADQPLDDRLLVPISTAGVPGGAAYSGASDRDDGYLIFVRAPGVQGSALMAQRFDPGTLETLGEPVPIADAESVPLAGFSVSNTGVLVHSTGGLIQGGRNEGGTFGVFSWLDRDGSVINTAGEPQFTFFTVALSPDATRVALSKEGDLWVTDLERGGETKLTFEADADDLTPIWSPDGSEIAFLRTDGSTVRVLRKPSDGAGAETLVLEEAEQPLFPSDWSADGRYMLISSILPGDIFAYPMDGSGQMSDLIPLTDLEANERGAFFSPNGRFFAYTSDETGAEQAFVRAFDPDSGSALPGKWMVSTNGGTSPHWSEDGNEIYYMSGAGDIMAVPVDMAGRFDHGNPEVLFRAPQQTNYWEVDGNGDRFLMQIPPEQSGQLPYRVVLNWTSLVE